MRPFAWGWELGGGICASLLPENNAQISLAPLRDFLMLPKIILTVLTKSLKVIQLLPSFLELFKTFLPHHHQKPKPKSENHILILLTAPLISGRVPQLPKYDNLLKINCYSSQIPKALGRGPYMYMAKYN